MTVRYADDGNDWMDHGACRDNPGVDPEWFFSKSQPEIDQAKRVCVGCDHTAACLAYANTHGEVGVWGGTDDNDRAKARRTARPLPAKCRAGHRMTGDNVQVNPDGRRRCRACWRAYHDRYNRERRVELAVIRGGEG